MDQSPSAPQTTQTFRAVPMAHLVKTSSNSYGASSPITVHSTASPPAQQRQQDGRLAHTARTQLPAEVVDTTSNLLKWKLFGLPVETSPDQINLLTPKQKADLHAALPGRDSAERHVAQNRCKIRSTEEITEDGPSTDECVSPREAVPPRYSVFEVDSISNNTPLRHGNVMALPPRAPTHSTGTTIRREFCTQGDSSAVGVPQRSSVVQSLSGGCTPPSPTPVVPSSPAVPLVASTEPDTAVDVADRIHRDLAQLSDMVQRGTEAQRCGPPTRPLSTGSWAGKKSKAGHRKGKSGEENDETTTFDPLKRGAGTKGNRRHAVGAVDTADKAPSTKKGGKRKRSGVEESRTRDSELTVFSHNLAEADRARMSHRTLFAFSVDSGAGLGGGGANGTLAGLLGAATAVVTITVPFLHLQSSTEELFHDLQRTLHDPDRIQAPPLFVGLSTLASDGAGAVSGVECRTNFTLHGGAAKAAKGRTSNCFSGVDPLRSHQHVELILARWKEAVYAMPAQTLGFAFLCRVLDELPGVEVITFNAQALLVALLAYRKGTLWSNCVSDVRVMAWMAQLHIGASAALPSRAGAEAVAAESDMRVLYDYEQLLLRVSGGKVPPSVQLKKAASRELPPSSHDTGFAPGESKGTESPSLTPAQQRLGQQVYYLATVYRSLYGQLGSKGLLQAFLRQEKRIALLLALMRFNGTGVDLHEVHRYQHACEVEMVRQRSVAATLVPELGNDFNIQSHDQCRHALYEVLQLGKFLTAKSADGADGAAGTGLTITKGGRLSTAEETLRALAAHHEFPACLLRYRKASKLMQTYVEGMMSYSVVRTDTPVSSLDALLEENPFIDQHRSSAVEASAVVVQLPAGEEVSVTAIGTVTLPSRGYATVHPNFIQEGTDTGRLSCVEPNLQNLPRNGATNMPAVSTTPQPELPPDEDAQVGEEDLLGFRRCFVAAEGYTLLSVDYQQIELRVLAHLCGDKSLVDALTHSADIHRAIAEVIFKKRTVSSEERSLAKRVVFGVLYGAGPKTLAGHMGVTVERALHITSLLTNAFPGIETYHRRVIEESRVNGFVRTISGRVRYLPDIQSTVMAWRSYAERQAFNSVVQGSAADVMKMAMLAVAKDVLQPYNRSEVTLLSQIHDEIVFMVRKDLLPVLVPIVSSAMSHAMQLLVPLNVTVKFGHSLGELQEWSVDHSLGLGMD